jgi:hypothetical protein
MKPMADPIVALRGFQNAINSGATPDPYDLEDNYIALYDEFPDGRKRYSYVKIVGQEVQALSIFGLEDPIKNIVCYNVGYAVCELHRKRGLAVEVVSKGLEKLTRELRSTNLEKFYLEAIVEVTNIASINTARKLFASPGRPMIDFYSKRPAVYFLKLINLQ